ncbi:MAG: GDP-L-fucose synthase [Bradymonadales bacterium]|jgi:GDP-L-fucose synthase
MNSLRLKKNNRIFLAGHRGLVGSAIHRALNKKGYEHVIVRSSQELDLRNGAEVDAFFAKEKPEVVILAAAKVGGIFANSAYPADFILNNLLIQDNVIGAAFRFAVKRLLFLGSSCIYPKHAEQPIKESSLLTGPLEPTNEFYAIAKIAGLKLCEALNRQYGCAYLSLMPTNLYGPGDNYHGKNSHVIPALIRKFHEAKIEDQASITLWGTGRARREFLFVDDMADAAIYLLENSDESSLINVGTGTDISIAELAQNIASVVGYKGKILFDHVNPDGTPRKLLDVSKLFALNWRPRVSLLEGLKISYEAFCAGELRM